MSEQISKHADKFVDIIETEQGVIKKLAGAPNQEFLFTTERVTYEDEDMGTFPVIYYRVLTDDEPKKSDPWFPTSIGGKLGQRPYSVLLAVHTTEGKIIQYRNEAGEIVDDPLELGLNTESPEAKEILRVALQPPHKDENETVIPPPTTPSNIAPTPTPDSEQLPRFIYKPAPPRFTYQPRKDIPRFTYKK